MDDLTELAARWAVELNYVDAQGRPQAVDPEAARRIVASLEKHGCETGAAQAGSAQAAGPRERAFTGEGRERQWLLAVQLYGIRSAANWGHGDFTDLAALVELAGDIGAAGIGLNPLHALYPDHPEQASPYSPNSRLFLNPLYIDVTAAPGFPGTAVPGLVDELEQLRAAPLVDYAGVARIKLRALRAAYHGFLARPDGEAEFEQFRQQRGMPLLRFAAFETLRQKFNKVWWAWPTKWRRPSDRVLAGLRKSEAEAVGFHEYLQWVADRQLLACRELARRRGCTIGLYIDLAVGVDPGGADAWAGQGAFLNDLSIGAPPDILNTSGQDWGLTTFNPHYLATCDFAPFRALLASAMRHAGAVRLDHILGLNRIYVIPRGMSARQGAYLRFPLEAMLNVVAQESQKHRCIVIGEDLGTVPEGFRQRLADHGILGYVVMLFEREHDGCFRGPECYPVNALATFATHDLATFSGWWNGHDLRVKRDLAIDPGESDAERWRARDQLRATVARHGQDDLLAVMRHLAETPSRLVAVAVEDVFGVADQINVPGTVNEHPNWRRRLPVTLEQMRDDGRLRQIAEVFRQAGRS